MRWRGGAGIPYPGREKRETSPHYSRTRLADNAGLTEVLVVGGPGRIKRPWGISTPHPSRGTRDWNLVHLPPCVISPRE
jgi:hypothetical protein